MGQFQWKMKPEVKKMFVEALRSGRYNKGYGYLAYHRATSEVCHCGEGVLCDLHGKATGGEEAAWTVAHLEKLLHGSLPAKETPFEEVEVLQYGKACSTMPREVIEWAFESLPEPEDEDDDEPVEPTLALRGEDGKVEYVGIPSLNDGGISWDPTAEKYVWRREPMSFAEIADLVEAQW